MTGRGVLVTLTPREREMINAAMANYRRDWVFSPAELEIMDNLMRRIPRPEQMDLR